MIHPFRLSQIFRIAIDMRDLFLADCHSTEVVRVRCRLIISRVRFAARIFAMLTMSWILVDMLTIDWPLWGVLAGSRSLAAAVFLILAHHRFEAPTLGAARRALAALLSTVIVFFLAAVVMFWLFPSGDQSMFATTTYFYAPYLAAAGLSIFPLTVLESAVLAAVVLGAMLIELCLFPGFMGAVSPVATLWRLFLVSAIGSLASTNQLGFLISLTEQSARDKLTGALNRQFGERLLDLQFAAAERSNRPLSLLFVDLDRFKSINDEHGHEAGDAVLQLAARLLRENLRHGDSIIRWGGEEFLLVLLESDRAQAEEVVLRLGKVGIGMRPDGGALTASIGVAERIGDGTDSWTMLVELADRRMYAAKRAGRNCRISANGAIVPFVVDPSGWSTDDDVEDFGQRISAHVAAVATERPKLCTLQTVPRLLPSSE